MRNDESRYRAAKAADELPASSFVSRRTGGKAEKRDAPKLAAARQGAAKPEEVIPLDDKELGNF